MKKREVILTMVLILTGAFALNFFILDPFFIPDICYYHNHNFKTDKLFDLFYGFPSAAGGHPSPTIFNFLFTVTAGALLGWLLSKLIFRKKVAI